MRSESWSPRTPWIFSVHSVTALFLCLRCEGIHDVEALWMHCIRLWSPKLHKNWWQCRCTKHRQFDTFLAISSALNPVFQERQDKNVWMFHSDFHCADDFVCVKVHRGNFQRIVSQFTCQFIQMHLFVIVKPHANLKKWRAQNQTHHTEIAMSWLCFVSATFTCCTLPHGVLQTSAKCSYPRLSLCSFFFHGFIYLLYQTNQYSPHVLGPVRCSINCVILVGAWHATAVCDIHILIAELGRDRKVSSGMVDQAHSFLKKGLMACLLLFIMPSYPVCGHAIL